MKKRILAMALVLVMLCGVLPVSAGAEDTYPTFSDVGTGQWFLDDVKYVWQQGLMDGVIDFQFYPEEDMDRLTMVTVLYRIEGEPSAPSAGFSDVYPDDAPAVDWAASQGIVEGYGDGHFGPYDTINREQMAAILFRYVSVKGLDRGERAPLTGFKDYRNISDWATEAMSWAVAKELIKGTDNNMVSPQAGAQRAQGAAIAHRFCEKILDLPLRADAPEFVPADLELFRELAGKEFFFGSGVGGWCTTLEVKADGSFTGTYHDSNMGDMGPGYPSGTMYCCSFRGKFTEVKKLDDYTYSMKRSDMEYDDVPGTEEIIDGVKYIYSEPYGMEGGGNFKVYLPGRSTADFSESLMGWLRAPNAWRDPPANLPFHVIHNLEYDYAFFD